MKNKYEKQQGNILISSLLILIVMNLLGAGLLQSASRESSLAHFKTIDSEVFHLTESCTHQVINYFEGITGTPASVNDVVVDNDALEDLLRIDTDTDQEMKKLDGYGYSCTTAFITSKSVAVGEGVGEEVGGGGGEYSGTGGSIIKDYYQVTATGSGPKNSTKVINSILSVTY